MSIAKQIYEVAKPLPESLALEALHFIEYLSSKNADHAEMTDLTRAQEIVMKHVWDNQVECFWNNNWNAASNSTSEPLSKEI